MTIEYQKLRVFLCHAKEDKPTVREICNLLNDEGWIKAWLDEDELLPGQNWDLEIKRAVKQSDIVLVCLSNKTVQKDGYVQKEIRYVIDVAEEKPEDKIFVIPVRMNDCLVPQRLQCWQWVDYFPKQNQDKAYKRLIESLKLSASRLEIPTGHPYKQFYTPINQSHVVNYLIGRQMQLEMFGRILDRINHESPISSNIFEWYGSPGIGKSTLVSMLANQAHEKHALHAIIDFRKLTSGKAKAYLHDPIVLIEDIVSALESQISLDTREFDSALMEYRSISLPQEGVAFAYDRLDQEARLYNRPRWLTALRDIVIAFIKLINLLRSQTGINQRKPFVLFFDETEYIDVEFVDWLEEWVINPLVQIKHCVIVWTARRPWRWKRPEIRRRMTSEMLTVFDPNILREQIQLGSTKPRLARELFNNIYSLTGGHPYANAILIAELDALATQGEHITRNNFQDFENVLMKDVFDKFINQYVFREMESNDLKIACKYISIVRLFDSTMLRKILQASAGDLFVSWRQEDFGDLMVRLKKTQLLVWEKGNAIDSGIRNIINKYLMSVERNTFIRANQAALQVYEDWLARPVDNRSLFVLEELYHHAALSQIGIDVDLNGTIRNRLAEYPAWIKDENYLDNALERLETEIINDKELAQLTPSTHELVNQVRAFRTEIRRE